MGRFSLTVLAFAAVLLTASSGSGRADPSSAARPGDHGAAALAKGDALFRNGDFDAAGRFYEAAAKAGNRLARTKLDGMSYVQPGDRLGAAEMDQAASMNLKGGRDVCDLMALYAKAAEAGNSEAAVRLGRLFQQWSNLPCTPPRIPGQPSLTLGKAMQCFIVAAKAGNTEGMQELAEIYLSGIGVPKDPAEGRQWLELAADRGSIEAETRLRQLDRSPRDP